MKAGFKYYYFAVCWKVANIGEEITPEEEEEMLNTVKEGICKMCQCTTEEFDEAFSSWLHSKEAENDIKKWMKEWRAKGLVP